MSKVFKLKNWLTISDAAKHLATVFGEDVTNADVLRFGLDRRLTLSVNFAGCPSVWRGSTEPYENSTDIVESLDGEIFQKEIGVRLTETKIMKVEGKLFRLEGTCDLPMIGNEKYHVERIYRTLVGWPHERTLNIEGTFLTVHGVEGIFALQADPNGKNQYVEIPPMPWHVEGYIPAQGLPDDSVLVVRTSELSRFVQSVAEESETIEKPLSTRERDTLLTIIAVLAKAAKAPLDDYSKPGKAAGYIEGLTDEFGAHVSKRAIEDHLKKIPDALGTRMK